jgi:hypothetical protein
MDATRIAFAAAVCGLGLGLAACTEAEPVTAPATDPGPPETVEILSPGTYRHGERFLDFDGLAQAFVAAGRGHTQPIDDPLLIVAPASLAVADVMPAISAVLQPPGRVNLTLRVIKGGVGRETTIPVLTGCMCRAVHFEDGGVAPLDHDSSTPYVFVTARLREDGLVRTWVVDFDEDGAYSLSGELPGDLPAGVPTLGEPLDLAALQTWFDALGKAGITGLLCLDYRDSLSAGRLVDALARAKDVLGRRVLLGPNPREPEVEEEYQDDWDEPGDDE